MRRMESSKLICAPHMCKAQAMATASPLIELAGDFTNPLYSTPVLYMCFLVLNYKLNINPPELLVVYILYTLVLDFK